MYFALILIHIYLYFCTKPATLIIYVLFQGHSLHLTTTVYKMFSVFNKRKAVVIAMIKDAKDSYEDISHIVTLSACAPVVLSKAFEIS